MATALDLLMNTKEDVNLLSEESDICTIDAKTRAIFVPSTIVVGGVQSDKNAERIKFSCPKIVGDNLDLSKFSVRINFENVSSVDFNVSIKDQYICDDVAVDGENVTFSWLIGRNAARYMGTVRFIVCAVKTDSDSNISVEWNTAIAEVPVLEGIEIDQPQIGQEEKDVINQLLELTKNTSAEAVQNVNSAKEQAIKDIQSVSQPDTTLTIEGGLAEAKATGEAIGSLKEDLGDTESKKIPHDELLTGYKYTNANDLKIGYIAISTGEEQEKIRSVYTKDFFSNGTVVNVTDTDKIGLAIYQYNKNTLSFHSARTDVQMPLTVNSNENVFKFAFYYKKTGIYTNISSVEANALKKYIKIQLNEKTDLKGNNKAIDEINSRLDDIKEGLRDVSLYYFKDNYLQNKVKLINDNMCGIGLNGESFVFITDPHWDLGNAKQSPKLIKYIKEKTNIDNIICGGDIINEGLHDTMLNVFLDFVNKMKKIGIPFPIAFGNHDMNTNANNPQSEWFDRNTVFDIEYKHVAKFITFISPENDFSFIYNRPEIKTRFIFIDTQKNGSIKWEAITPISESFNKVPEDYKVVVVCHWLLGDNSIPTGWGQRILDTIDAYNARTTYTNDQTKTYDYTNANGKCVLICCGHTHYDTQIVTNGGVPLLNTTCDNYNRSNSGLERKEGTITEQAFDVVSVNYADDSVKVVRIGSGNDRIFSQGKWEVIN